MIKKITLKNFRNFENSEFFFSEKENIILGENGFGKTNILLAISLFSNNYLENYNFDYLVENNKEIFYIEIIDFSENKLSISYNKKEKKKKYMINNKTTTKTKLNSFFSKIVSFSPISMNMMYLGPSLRREFLDNILKQCFSKYNNLLKEYKKVLYSRNKVLKNIKEGKSNKSEIIFWNEKFSYQAAILYNYRFGLINFLKENTKDFQKYLISKITTFEIFYKTKIIFPKDNDKEIQIKNIQNQILLYLEKNIEKDIILTTTNIGPHIDDFEIIIDKQNLVNFASRGEVKSIIIGLKFLEVKFLKKYNENKQPILLIDDLLSELDIEHKNLVLNNIKNYQSFITSIRNEYNNLNIISLKK